jgi:lysophospholipase L1-like esterase
MTSSSRPPRGRRARHLATIATAAGTLLLACTQGGADPGTTLATPTTAGTTAATPTTEAASPTVRIMPLGDSITEGGDPGQPTTSPQSYRGLLQQKLVAAGYDVDFVGGQSSAAYLPVPDPDADTDHEGHGGFTVGPDASTLCTGCGPANIADNVEGWLTGADPDIVLLLVGVNDLLPQQTPSPGGFVRPVDPMQAGPKLKALVADIRSTAPEATVLVASYPPISFLVDPALGSKPAFDALNAAAEEVAAGGDDQVVYVPVYETLQDDWTKADRLANGDELHPSAAGAEKLAEVFFSTLRDVLGPPSTEAPATTTGG